MFIDAREVPDGETIEADLCVIGAGAAGITIAREMAGTQHRVVVLESGGLDYDERTQSLYEGTNIGMASFDLDINRLRYFGGTTNHWAGHCRPLDPIDFERRSWVPYSGWPISRQDLVPYYLRALPILELPPFHFDDLDFLVAQTGEEALALDPARLQSAVYYQSPPTRFGEVYREEIGAATSVRVYLHANALELESDQTGSEVTGVQVACIDGPRFQVTARQYVLAMGGMEIPRLMLLSNRHVPAGLGNQHDLVGRFFMDHIVVRPAVLVLLASNDISLPLYHDLHTIEGGEMFAILSAPERLMREEELLDFRIHVDRVKAPGPGQQSLIALVRALRGGSVPDDLGRHLGNILADLDVVTDLVYRRVFGAGSEPTEPDDTPFSIRLDLVVEAAPDPDSRITLSGERDLFGQNRIAVDWRLSDLDLRTARRAIELAALEFGRLGFGRGRGDLLEDGTGWPADTMEAGKHHCGTARMAADPKTGVVDANCRVHGMSNLYVAGSAVFPTIGYANPTLTIVALALRLADHLKDQMA